MKIREEVCNGESEKWKVVAVSMCIGHRLACIIIGANTMGVKPERVAASIVKEIKADYEIVK